MYVHRTYENAQKTDHSLSFDCTEKFHWFKMLFSTFLSQINASMILCFSILNQSLQNNKQYSKTCLTVMRIIKFNLFPFPVRLHSGFGEFNFRRYFTIFCDI